MLGRFYYILKHAFTHLLAALRGGGVLWVVGLPSHLLIEHIGATRHIISPDASHLLKAQNSFPETRDAAVCL